MSILKTLQGYLEEFPGMELRKLNTVLTDVTDEDAGSYAIAPSGNGRTVTDILGNRTYENNYVFYAKEAALNEVDREENYDFLESFSDWLEGRVDIEEFPELGEFYTVENLELTNAMMLDIYEDGTGLYQVQIKLIFTKKRIGGIS